jgi:hypothetical protein
MLSAKNIFSKILQQGSSGVDFSISLLSNHRSIAYSCARQFLTSLKMRLVSTTVRKDPDPDHDNLSAENPT